MRDLQASDHVSAAGSNTFDESRNLTPFAFKSRVGVKVSRLHLRSGGQRTGVRGLLAGKIRSL